MDNHGKIAERKDRWTSFLSGKGPDFMFVVRTPDNNPRENSMFWPGNEEQFIEHSWKAYLGQCEQLAWLDDDFVPFLSCITGTEISILYNVGSLNKSCHVIGCCACRCCGWILNIRIVKS